eukprot:CAMPEP_0113600290 /NCGR_PEP_ID=MMETSP0015_2-20120614/42628_1 /TAXON_ID=2838 /ORGANISM="Odontella" /LENGTH=586 /DNA_ID=CAMNT_0000508537 /DNA_START=301 /DNA_END=2061 /DNA_ORIENTATION=+ /assembly_acc=CAM_ASM_000160
MPLRYLEASLQEEANSGILKACERFAIDVRGRTEFIFDSDAQYTKKRLAPSTLDAHKEFYWICWQFFASTGYYESILPLIKSPALLKPFPAMQVEALAALIRCKCLPKGAVLTFMDNSKPVQHVITGEVVQCSNEWNEKDLDAFTAAISRLHRAVGHRIDGSPSQTVCEVCLANYRATGGDRTGMEPCSKHRTETANPPIFRFGDPTRTALYKVALSGGGLIKPEQNEGTNQTDDTGNNHKIDWIFWRLSKLPIASHYPDLLKRCRPIVDAWHGEFSVSQPPVWWGRMRRNLPKELNESAFILDQIISIVDDYSGDQPITIVDMCSGVGFLSMFLSHLLPPSKVSRIVAVDVLFRSHNDAGSKDDRGKCEDTNNPELSENRNGAREKAKRPQTQHLPTSHLYSSIHPIPIRPRRANIRKGRELRQISQYCIEQAPGPVVILGIHLCKALSVHTVRLFVNTTKASRLYLKPCCLPGRRDLAKKHPPFWTFDRMEGGGFGVETLYCQDITDKNESLTEVAEATEETEHLTGAHDKEENRNTKPRGFLFSKWVKLLRDAADTAPSVTAEIHHLPVQIRGLQNQFIVATR